MNEKLLKKNSALIFIGRYWTLIFLIGEFIIFSIIGTGYFTIRNFQNMLVASTIILLLATGETFVIITGGIDLSVGFVMGFMCVVFSKILVTLMKTGMSQEWALFLSVVSTLLIGLLPGLLNGYLVARWKVPPFIATFGMYGIAYGMAEIISNNVPISGLPPLTGQIGNGYFMYWLPGKLLAWFSRPHLPRAELRHLVNLIPNIFLISIIFVIIFAFILSKTRFGQHTYAIGGNIDAAIRAGINVKAHLIKIYMTSSFFATLGGIVYSLRFVTGRADAGSANMLDSIVAVVIGGASLYGGTGTIWGTFIGTMIITILETGMVNLGLPTYNKYIVVGIVLIFAVLMDQFFPEIVHKGE